MEEEHQQAKEAMDALGGRRDEYAAEIRIVSRDALKSGHGRDYRGFAIFYQELFRRDNITVRAFYLRSRDGDRYILTSNRILGQ